MFLIPIPKPVTPEPDLNDERHQMTQEQIDAARKSPAYTHNNPGHLLFNEQENATKGALTKDGNWAQFTTPEEGIKAMIHDIVNVKIAGKSDHINKQQSLRDLVRVYSSTDHDSYERLIEDRTGLPVYTRLEHIPKHLINPLIRAMIRKENVQFYKENIDTIKRLLPDQEPEDINKAKKPSVPPTRDSQQYAGSLMEYLQANGNAR